VEGVKLLDLSVLDHLIVCPTKGEYFSFAGEGLKRLEELSGIRKPMFTVSIPKKPAVYSLIV